ncbi:MAG TPA: PP2C family protein-serine/threonine phosphatase [Terracidiphilus sp.]|nr:PP2C family protein-serine/threonine phosphatase [Terracidiphilus sp.]
MNTHDAWQTTPLRSKVIFLLAVFFTFVGISVAGDVTDMGRQPVARFAVSAILSGLFAVGYALSGALLHGKFWKAAIPLFAAQFVCLSMVVRWLPDGPDLTQMTAGVEHLRGRLSFDGTAIIVTVCLGYAGLVYGSISAGRRYMQSQLEKAALESEMAAAREVQRVMVPQDLPAVVGYQVESVYRPAAEVGGDFFQILPLRSGRTLVVIGDVSGKGLRAAMIVSMIVGMLRAVSDFTEEPAEILAELNRRLYGQTQGAFATCLVVRLENAGRLTLANAGHLPPYLNGVEFPFAGSMPLGLVESSEYEQTELEIRMGDRVVLVTDGIAEARNQQRELLGFSRVESLLQEGATAKSMAEAAQKHGQEDDLTVIGIERRG